MYIYIYIYTYFVITKMHEYIHGYTNISDSSDVECLFLRSVCLVCSYFFFGKIHEYVLRHTNVCCSFYVGRLFLCSVCLVCSFCAFFVQYVRSCCALLCVFFCVLCVCSFCALLVQDVSRAQKFSLLQCRVFCRKQIQCGLLRIVAIFDGEVGEKERGLRTRVRVFACGACWKRERDSRGWHHTCQPDARGQRMSWMTTPYSLPFYVQCALPYLGVCGSKC